MQPTVPPAANDAPRFGLRALLIAVAAVAIVLGAMRSWGIMGAVTAFMLAVLGSLFAARRWHHTTTRLAFDLTWGIVMPLICLAYDPFVFQQIDPGTWEGFPSLSSFRWEFFDVLCYATIGYQLLLLAVWLGFGHALRRWSGFFAGGLAVGGLLASLIGLLVFLPSLFAFAWYFIGALGFTPLVTATTYFRRSLEARAIARAYLTRGVFYASRLAGAAVAGGVPLVVLMCRGFLGL
jgi:hypothetical protein